MYDIEIKISLTSAEVEKIYKLNPNKLLSSASALIQEVRPKSEIKENEIKVVLDDLRSITPTLGELITLLKLECLSRKIVWGDTNNGMPKKPETRHRK